MLKKLSWEQRNKFLLIAGIVCIVIGLLLAFLLILDGYCDCAKRYQNNLDGFGSKYDSVWDCFTERSTGLIFVSLFLGSIPFILGCYLIRIR